jgi:hypothetical protein
MLGILTTNHLSADFETSSSDICAILLPSSSQIFKLKGT